MKQLTTMLGSLGFGLFISSLLLLAGCSKHEVEGDCLPQGQHPMTFTATVEGLTITRATTDNSWAGGEEVAIQVGTEVKRYTATAVTGVLSAASDVAPWYWQNTAETKTVAAWHSHNYSADRPASFTVHTDQSGAGYQQSDMLYAAAQQVTFADRTLTFKHLPAKVVVNLTNGDGVTVAEVTNATVTIESQATTSGAISPDWAVAQATSGSSILTPNVLPTPTTNYQKSAQAIVVPRQMQNKKFIRVTVGGSGYLYTPTDATDTNLEAGKQYTYNITVKKSGITVKVSGATGWTGSTTPVISKDPRSGFTATDLKAGDYYYSDGTWSDGGYRVYTDDSKVTLPIMPALTNAATGAEREVIGIVYWVVDATAKDKTLRADHAGCTHGLVVSLKEYKDVVWQDPLSFVQAWLNNNKPDDFLSVQTDKKADAPLNNIQGYNNTKAIEAFNTANPGHLVTPVQKVVEYRFTVLAPMNSSGWYLPSAKELSLLCGTDVDDIGNKPSGTANRDLINGKLSSVDGATQFSSSYYWSSSENSNTNAFIMQFGGSLLGSGDKRRKENVRVRFSLAF